MSRKEVWRVIKERFVKHGVRIIHIYNTGGVALDYEKPKEKYSFGEKENKTSSYITDRHHFDVTTGKPVVFLVQGVSTNVNLLRKPEKNAPIVEQAIIRAENYGITKTMARMQHFMKDNKWLLIMIVGALLASIAAAYFSFQTLDAIQAIGG